MRFMPPGAFITHLVDVLGFRRRRPVESRAGLDIYYLDLTSLKLDLGPFVPFVTFQKLAPRLTLTEDDLRDFVSDLTRVGKLPAAQVAILVVGGLLENLSEDFRSDLNDRLIAVLDASTIASVYAADSRRGKHKLFVAAVAGFVGRHALSPYTMGSPAWGGRFFGRTNLVKEIIGSGIRGNYIIVGSRRIGKTSLLKELRHRFDMMTAPVLMSEIYGGSCHGTEDVLTRLMGDLGSTSRQYLNKRELIRNFSDFIEHINKPIVIFVDELDTIIEWDRRQRYELLEILREVFSADGRRIFFAGFRTTIAAQRSVASPLFNFAKTVFLGPLQQSEAKEMLTRPMDLLGVDISADFASTVYSNTTGRPELVQFCCSEVLKEFEEKRTLPDHCAFQASLNASVAFAERVVASFLSSADENERLLCRLLAARACETGKAREDYSFSLGAAQQELSRAVSGVSLSETNNILTSLILLGAIVKTGSDKFRFAAPILADSLAGVLQGESGFGGSVLGEPVTIGLSGMAGTSDLELPALDNRQLKIFISFTEADLDWAHWIAWTLEKLGHSVIFQAWDFGPGTNFVTKMQSALGSAEKLILVLSEDYLRSSFAASEWAAMFQTDPVGSERRILPIRVRECRPTGLLSTIVFLDLVGKTEQEAKRSLTFAFQDRLKPIEEPKFPLPEIAASRVPFPG